MRYDRSTLATLVLVGGAAALLWLTLSGGSGSDAPPRVADDGHAVRVAPPVATAPRPSPVAPPAKAPVAEPQPLSSEERAALVEEDPELRDRALQMEFAAEADARWDEAVDAGEYTADDLDPAVRTLFKSMRLEPVYLEGGRIDGLVIEELPGDHPLARAGFEVGDHLVRIQGVELRDPAEIPSLLDHLGPNITFCLETEGEEMCEDVHLN